MTDVADLARRIANGHAYQKHVVKRGEFPTIANREQFAQLIEDVITNFDEVQALRGNRYLYWQVKAQMIVIVDPRNPDGGSAFRRIVGLGDLNRFS